VCVYIEKEIMTQDEVILFICYQECHIDGKEEEKGDEDEK